MEISGADFLLKNFSAGSFVFRNEKMSVVQRLGDGLLRW